MRRLLKIVIKVQGEVNFLLTSADANYIPAPRARQQITESARNFEIETALYTCITDSLYTSKQGTSLVHNKCHAGARASRPPVCNPGLQQQELQAAVECSPIQNHGFGTSRLKLQS